MTKFQIAHTRIYRRIYDVLYLWTSSDEEHLARQVSLRVSGAVGAAVGGAVGAAVGGAVGAAVGGAVGAAVGAGPKGKKQAMISH